MLRVDVVPSHSAVSVRAAGRLAGQWVAELADTLERIPRDQPLELDLTEVSFADASGIALLHDMQRRRAVQLRCSAFLAAQLD